MQRQALALFERLQDFGPALASGAVSRKHAETAAADGGHVWREAFRTQNFVKSFQRLRGESCRD